MSRVPNIQPDLPKCSVPPTTITSQPLQPSGHHWDLQGHPTLIYPPHLKEKAPTKAERATVREFLKTFKYEKQQK